jgi:hypothetical protein
MLEINVKVNGKELLNPADMLKDENAEKVFMLYDLKKNDYIHNFFINCGRCEKSVINIWYDDESKKYRLSTDTLASLKEYNKHIKVIDITDTINMSINLDIG